MYISEVEFSNFQGHELTLLEFSDKLNIIKGRTHSGKSSLVRGMKWAYLNRPRGDNFRRDGITNSESVSVSTAFSEGTSIIREKNPSRSLNVYITSEHEDPFAALRMDVPDEVKEITKMSDENIVSQGDGYFLIGKTSGQVARELNKVLGLEIIDAKAREAKKVVSEAKSRITFLAEQRDEKQAELDNNFDGLDDMVESVGALDSAIIAHSEESRTIQDVNTILESIEESREVVEAGVKFVSLESDILLMKKNVSDVAAERAKVDSVEAALNSISYSRKQISESEHFTDSESEIKSLLSRILKLSERRSKLLKIETLYSGIGRERSTKEEARERELSYVLRRKEIEKSLEACPRCGAIRKYWNSERSKE